MSDEHKTQETPDGRSFEERVFARFDALDSRLNGMDERLQSLEAKRYDTKPIWERALSEIAETRTEMRAEIAETRTEMRAEIAETRTEMRAEFEKTRAESQSNFRRLERKIEVLNDELLEQKAGMRDVESRMDKIDKSHV